MENYIEAVLSTGEYSVVNEGNGNTIKSAFEQEGYVVECNEVEYHFIDFLDAYDKFIDG